MEKKKNEERERKISAIGQKVTWKERTACVRGRQGKPKEGFIRKRQRALKVGKRKFRNQCRLRGTEKDGVRAAAGNLGGERGSK